ncbi:hypothetical protein [Singulisphaera acidiphila]|uniref:Uncharacterized protein n=1 Tax=Singulisphaera acidiphila (strain ATCC BAA-1392 / DSM 18658 / VKM B-2454 / MOB10) TaxID=886293 RepID=L0DNR1_SINAD|nr:hypothetical protein [Singulisphaera acidiphila]AGA30488.1 hypothetical protein Sinac_6408 [Singulisphaera acidiphila DSM 18658]
MIRLSRMCAALFLAATFGLAVAPMPVAAQEPAAEGGEGGESGRPVDGYIATAILAFLALFVVGKSARR